MKKKCCGRSLNFNSDSDHFEEPLKTVIMTHEFYLTMKYFPPRSRSRDTGIYDSPRANLYEWNESIREFLKLLF
jgi:hypothetical protein